MSSANFLLRRLLHLYVYQPSRIFSVNSTNLILYVYPFQGGGPPAVALANFFGEFYKDLILRRLLLSNLSRGVGPPRSVYAFSAAREARAASGSAVAVVEPSAKTFGFWI